MANDLNQCNFIGRLSKDVDLRYMPDSETAVASFSIAVNWKSKGKEGVEWVNIVAFGKLAEICSTYLSKGSKIFISGRFKTRSWEDKNTGEKKYLTEIIANEMQMLDSRPNPAGVDGGVGQRGQGQSTSSSPNDFYEDDVPFMRLTHEYIR